jgi:alpha-glucosidase
VTNISGDDIDLPEHSGILLSSSPLVAGRLPTDSTAWLRTQHRPPEVRAV